VIQALRRLDPAERPEQVLGCELWRGLDWLPDEDKVLLDVSQHAELSQKLNAQFRSQIDGGKRYDRAIPGRQYANATFLNPHQTDAAERLAYAMDLTPLIRDDTLAIDTYVRRFIDRMAEAVTDGLARMW
jgi:hypothetical protein